MERVKLKKLLKDIAGISVRGSKEIEITGVCSHSKRVAPGNLFIAKKGLTCDGAQFMADAIASGAVAVLTDMYDPFFPHVVQIIAQDVLEVEALIAQEYYQHASLELFLVGVTGTNGKTTTAYLIQHLFERMQFPCGLIGTIESIVGQHVFPSSLTTSDVLTNHKLFHEMVAEGCKGCVMEVSSHALDQQRVRGIEFDVAVFTNLTHDHLDYHQTMDAYARAKSQLFSALKKGKKNYPKIAVINTDNAYAQQMIQECSADVLTYGIEGSAALMAKDIRMSPSGTSCTICYQGASYPFSTTLIGRFNVYNVLAAIAVGIIQSYPLEKIVDALSSFQTIQGRLERVENAKGLHIFVDYAHKTDALASVLSTLREIGKKRIITVFGCGGNRDRAKRPKMGAVAEQFSDIVIITTDNPRSEDPLDIIAEILPGLQQPSRAYIIPDRAEAIRSAVALCTPEDILLIAGKGHETQQIFSHSTVPFDDRKIAREACGIPSVISESLRL